MSLKQNFKPLEKFSNRHRTYAEHLSTGKYTAADAARLSGFTESMALSRCSEWLRPTRENSKFPALWDYYEGLRKKRLRKFELTEQSILDEIQSIAFASIASFVQTPTRRDLLRRARYEAHVRETWGQADEDDRVILSQDPDQESRDVGLLPRDPITNGIDIDRIIKYAPGNSIKLKAYEDVPEELWPQVESISESRDGIRIKLHNKLAALELLAKIKKMDVDTSKVDKPTVIQNFEIKVNGSRSTLLSTLEPTKTNSTAQAADDL